jgi:hypothetical protein
VFHGEQFRWHALSFQRRAWRVSYAHGPRPAPVA